MPYSSTLTYNHCVLFYIVPNKVIFLFLIALFLSFANDVNAQITCDSDPKVIDTSTDTSNGIECSNNDDAEIILERGVKIEPTNNHGIHISNSENVSIIAKGDTSINTSGDDVYGILVEYDPANPGSLITIEVDDITSSVRNTNDITPLAGIKVRAPGQVDITSTGKISTLGENVDGILVENPIGSNGGEIDISVNDIETQGMNSDGIRVTSIISIGDGTPFLEREIGITVNGTVKTSEQFAQGIIVEFADSNIKVDINPRGKVIAENTDTDTFALALIGTQIGNNNYFNKTAVIENMGLVNGNILTEGCAQFNNHGTTISQGSITISSTNCDTIGMKSGFFNFGTVDVGGKNNIKKTTLTGNFYQENNGKLVIDVDWSKPDGDLEGADLLSIVGKADLKGNLVVNPLKFPDLTNADLTKKKIKMFTFLDATEGISGNFQYISRTSVLLSNRVTKSTDYKKLDITISLGLDLLNRNQTNLFWGLNDAKSRSDDIKNVFWGLFEEVELSNLQKTLDSFGNEIAGATVRSEFRNMERLALPNDYCENKPTGQVDEFNRHSSKECKFFTAKIQNGSHSGNFEQRAHKDKLIEGIFKIPLFENKADGQIQLVGQINNTRNEISDFAKSDGYSGTLGLGYYQEGDYGKLSLLAHLGMGSHEISRSFTAIDKSLTSKGTLDIHSAGISAEISNSFKIWNGTLNWYARVGYSGVKSKSYTETGGEDFALIVDKTSTKSLVINPRFEFVGESRNFQTLDIQPMVGGGILHRTKPAIEFHSKFAAGGDKILSTTVLPKTEFNYFLG
ncbi:MAG: autotransporter outer membrane beta-barrel domain-containing protein, partial [Paracoccaceae bacterium]|nr:autotransporter outer membrane beta-barrel domain-containing protein [Paracoccaceae bacterium]